MDLDPTLLELAEQIDAELADPRWAPIEIDSLREAILKVDALVDECGNPAPVPVISLAALARRDIAERFPDLSDEGRFRMAEWVLRLLANLATSGDGIDDPKLTHAVWSLAITAFWFAAPLRVKVGLMRLP